jgi:plasmid stabilization system protein ParE
MRVLWIRAASQDRFAIIQHIAADNPAAAERMDSLFSSTTKRLAAFPMLGHKGRLPSTREILPHPSYRLVYTIDDETIWILALVHTSRLWPPLPPF